jgi:benzil reductase ((S)-benzoin forming)
MKDYIVLITGVTSGLGLELYDLFSEIDVPLIGVSRKITTRIKDIISDKTDSILFMEYDLSELKIANNLINKIKCFADIFKVSKFIYINNASSISPIDMIGKLDINTVIDTINLNTVMPVIITNYIKTYCDDKNITLEVINITSGAAKNGKKGLAIYSATKAFNELFFNVLSKEGGTSCKHIDPGIMDTKMQKLMRSTKKIKFPDVEYFKKIKNSNNINTALNVATTIVNSIDIKQ